MFWLNKCCSLRKFWIVSSRLSSSSYFDAYKILGIPYDANETTIKNAYYRLAKEYHPDRNPSDHNAKEKFEQIQNAYRRMMEKIASNSDDPTVKEMPYSLTLEPLGVETHPVPTMIDHPVYKNAWLLITLMLIVGVLNSFKAPIGIPIDVSEGEDEEVVVERKLEEMRRRVIVQQKREDLISSVGTEMNEILKSFKPR